jgi:hemoglobin
MPGPLERDHWMRSMIRAMEETGVADRLRAALAQAFSGTADWMRNRPE